MKNGTHEACVMSGRLSGASLKRKFSFSRDSRGIHYLCFGSVIGQQSAQQVSKWTERATKSCGRAIIALSMQTNTHKHTKQKEEG